MHDLDRIRGRLAAVLPNGEAITRIAPLTSGFSNETYLIEGLDLILRLPPSAGAMLDGHDVVGQARIYAELSGIDGAPPVPAIVAIEEDRSGEQVPFFVMERVHGVSIDDLTMPAWFTDGSDTLRGQICSKWVSAFAGLSQLRPLSVLGTVIEPEADARMWQKFGRNANSPRLAAMFDRLLAHPAPRSGAPAVVHGDAKLANLMWDDGDILAMFDWEMALNGEPLADLGYLLYAFESEYHGAARAQKLPGMLKRDEVIALWSAVSGRPVDGLLWHEIAQMGKLSAIIAEGANMFETGRSSDPKLTIFKQSLDYYLGVMQAMLDGAGY